MTQSEADPLNLSRGNISLIDTLKPKLYESGVLHDISVFIDWFDVTSQCCNYFTVFILN